MNSHLSQLSRLLPSASAIFSTGTLATAAFLAGAAPALNAQDLTVRALDNAAVLSRTTSSADLQGIGTGNKVDANENSTHPAPMTASSATSSATGTANLWVRAGTSPMEPLPLRGFIAGLHASFSYLGATTGDGAVATTAAASSGGAQPGPVSFLVTFRQPASVGGVFAINWTGWDNPNGRWTADVDVGNDNSVEFSADSANQTNRTTDYPVSFANGNVDILVTMSGTATNAPAKLWNAFQTLRISLIRKGSCNLSSYGTSCGGAQLDAGLLTIGSAAVMATKLSGGVQNGFFVRAVGSKRVDVPLPGGCRLLAEPLVVDLLQADAQGTYKESFLVPAARNFKVTIQYVPFELVGGQMQARATQAWEMTCSGF
jgi:hypothetical protein